MFRNGSTCLCRVIRVVETDTHEFADPADTGTEARIAFDRGQARRIERPQFIEARVRKHVARYIIQMRRQVAQNAVRIQHSGFLGAGRAIT